jgi:hypothetical protein
MTSNLREFFESQDQYLRGSGVSVAKLTAFSEQEWIAQNGSQLMWM